MKKLLILIIVLACMGCDDCGQSAMGPDGVFSPVCQQPSGESCGFLKEWDECSCQCEYFWR